MDRFLDGESNGGIDIACSEPNILTCKVIGRKQNIYYNATRSELSPHYNLYIFKTSPVLLVFQTCSLQNWSL